MRFTPDVCGLIIRNSLSKTHTHVWITGRTPPAFERKMVLMSNAPFIYRVESSTTGCSSTCLSALQSSGLFFCLFLSPSVCLSPSWLSCSVNTVLAERVRDEKKTKCLLIQQPHVRALSKTITLIRKGKHQPWRYISLTWNVILSIETKQVLFTIKPKSEHSISSNCPFHFLKFGYGSLQSHKSSAQQCFLGPFGSACSDWITERHAMLHFVEQQCFMFDILTANGEQYYPSVLRQTEENKAETFETARKMNLVHSPETHVFYITLLKTQRHLSFYHSKSFSSSLGGNKRWECLKWPKYACLDSPIFVAW